LESDDYRADRDDHHYTGEDGEGLFLRSLSFHNISITLEPRAKLTLRLSKIPRRRHSMSGPQRSQSLLDVSTELARRG
jgi:hypothetical protein